MHSDEIEHLKNGTQACLCNNRKDKKKFGHPKNCCYHPKILTVSFYHRVMRPKEADDKANSVNQGLHCLPRPVSLNTLDH